MKPLLSILCLFVLSCDSGGDGDGTLSHFPSAIDATNCSLELKNHLKIIMI